MSISKACKAYPGRRLQPSVEHSAVTGVHIRQISNKSQRVVRLPVVVVVQAIQSPLVFWANKQQIL